MLILLQLLLLLLLLLLKFRTLLGHVSSVPAAGITPLLWFQPPSSAVSARIIVGYTLVDLKPLLQFSP